MDMTNPLAPANAAVTEMLRAEINRHLDQLSDLTRRLARSHTLNDELSAGLAKVVAELRETRGSLHNMTVARDDLVKENVEQQQKLDSAKRATARLQQLVSDAVDFGIKHDFKLAQFAKFYGGTNPVHNYHFFRLDIPALSYAYNFDPGQLAGYVVDVIPILANQIADAYRQQVFDVVLSQLKRSPK